MDWPVDTNILIDHFAASLKRRLSFDRLAVPERSIVATFIGCPHSAAVMLESAVRGEVDDEFNH